MLEEKAVLRNGVDRMIELLNDETLYWTPCLKYCDLGYPDCVRA